MVRVRVSDLYIDGAPSIDISSIENGTHLKLSKLDPSPHLDAFLELLKNKDKS